MKITVQIQREYNVPDNELQIFREKCLEFAEEHFEECAIKGLDDIPTDTVLGVITDAVSEHLTDSQGYVGRGIELDDHFNTIWFDYYEEDARDLVAACVAEILTDIDYEPKFRQLLELSDNLVTGYFGNEATRYGSTGFNLYSQVADMQVMFNPMSKTWEVIVDDGNFREVGTGCGWNELVDYLRTGTDSTWFMHLSEEDAQKCKLYKEKKA